MVVNAYFLGDLEVTADWAMPNRRTNLFQDLSNSLILRPKVLKVFIAVPATLWLLMISVIFEGKKICSILYQ